MRETGEVWRGHCSLWVQGDYSITPWNTHAINKVIAPPIVSSQTHPSQRKLNLLGPPFWLYTDQPSPHRTVHQQHANTSSTTVAAMRYMISLLLTALELVPVLFFTVFILFSLSPCPGSKPKGITSAPMRWWLKCQCSDINVMGRFKKSFQIKTKEWQWVVMFQHESC